MSDSALTRLLEHLPGPDTVSQAAVAERAATALRPAGAFGRLDAVASWLAAWQWSTAPKVEKPAVVVFGADHGVAAEGVTRDDLQAQRELVAKVQALSERASALAATARRRGRGDASDATRAALDAINDRLNNARETYPQQMLLSQVRYLSSMINRADQRPGNHAYQRYEQLAAEVRTLEQQLAALDGK